VALACASERTKCRPPLRDCWLDWEFCATNFIKVDSDLPLQQRAERQAFMNGTGVWDSDRDVSGDGRDHTAGLEPWEVLAAPTGTAAISLVSRTPAAWNFGCELCEEAASLPKFV